jgi:hypothetical protein
MGWHYSALLPALMARAVAMDKNFELSVSAREVKTTGDVAPKITPATLAEDKMVISL